MPTDTYLDDIMCDSCGDTITNGDYQNGNYSYCGDCGEYRCDNCDECERDHRCDCGECSECRDHRIHEWDYKPSSFRPKGKYPQQVLMGVELEVGRSASTIAECVWQVDPDEYHLYLKEDGSITGAEIVTHPMTLQWAREWKVDGKPTFNLMLRQLRDSYCSVDYSYGLHVHVSRNAFRQAMKRREVYHRRRGHVTEQAAATHQLTWLLFIYRNQRQLESLARRDPGRWAAFYPQDRGVMVRKAKSVPDTGDDRYVAVNCNNSRTYELRFFASTLNETEFWAALEFADASVEYTRHLKANDILKSQALQWGSFVYWVGNHNYPNLYAQMKALGIASMLDPNQTTIEV